MQLDTKIENMLDLFGLCHSGMSRLVSSIQIKIPNIFRYFSAILNVLKGTDCMNSYMYIASLAHDVMMCI